MTFKEFQQTPSWGTRAICPRCLSNKTMPYPNCGCRAETGGREHIMKYHHCCPSPSKFYDATNDTDVIAALINSGVMRS
jgi:hypothetical protein